MFKALKQTSIALQNLTKKQMQALNEEDVYKVPINIFPKTLTEFNNDYDYPNNYIKTAKYTAITFIPLNLFQQFKRVYNIYFLFAAIFSFIPSASTISPVTQVMPLVAVLAVTALKDAIEDYNRYLSDQKANNSPVHSVSPEDGTGRDILSQDLKAGDIVMVKKGDLFPCDMILLSSSFSDGTCFIETSQLDGETNLKRRSALAATMGCVSGSQIIELKGKIECEMPNNRLNQFNGRLLLGSGSEEKQYPLTVNQMLLRGAELRNTDFVYGICIFAGVDTKVYRNLQISKLKFSTLDSRLNRLLLMMFGYNALILIVSVILGSQWAYSNLEPGQAWYLFNPNQLAASVSGIQAMTYYILYTYTIPISLFISLELVRLAQSFFIKWDEKLIVPSIASASTGNPVMVDVLVRNSNLNEDLGKIEYIFSDKTGTLTQNIMRLSKWFVSNSSGSGILFDEASKPKSVSNLLSKGSANNKQAELFIRHVVICHTAIPNFDETSGEYHYEAESPDEAALLHNMRENGIIVTNRGKKSIALNVFGKDESYELLELIEFTSDRKRMSVILRLPNEGIVLFCKGADNMIMERLSKDSKESTFRKDCDKKLIEFSDNGLRTLCYSYVKLTEDEFLTFRKAYDEASAALVDRDEKMNEAAKLVETNMTLLGISAIEDRLQDKVPETIEFLLRCGIKLWVLTGDKRETAIKIALSCKLFTKDMNIMILEIDKKEEAEPKLQDLYKIINKKNNDDNNALVVTGESLRHILEVSSDSFLKVGRRCHAVVCCRVTPLQKAQVVKLVKKKEKKVCLSIGDGANDVSMIQTANIGVGIIGLEGGQAVRASDYAVGQFQCLKRLVAYHGRFCNIRQRKLIFFSLYKNLMFITICFWYGLHSGWCGYSIYQEDFLSMFNVVFTSLPPVALGIFEKDIDDSIIDGNPESYKQAAHQNFFRPQVLGYYLLLGFWHSIALYFGLVVVVGDGTVNEKGNMIDFWMISWLSSTMVMMLVMLKFMSQLRLWDIITVSMVSLSIVVYVSFMYLAQYLQLITEDGSATDVSSLAIYYFYSFGVVIAALIPDFFALYCTNIFNPSDDDILREMSIGQISKHAD